MTALLCLKRRENADRYHLVTIKAACRLQLFPAIGGDGGLWRGTGAGDDAGLTLGQFCGAMACDRRLLAGRNDEDIDQAAFGAETLLCLIICGRIHCNPQPSQAITYLQPYLLAVFTDAAGENKAFQTAQRVSLR